MESIVITEIPYKETQNSRHTSIFMSRSALGRRFNLPFNKMFNLRGHHILDVFTTKKKTIYLLIVAIVYLAKYSNESKILILIKN